ncbi:TPA: hypothetical protein ACHV9H_001218 [Providencia stuartii]
MKYLLIKDSGESKLITILNKPPKVKSIPSYGKADQIVVDKYNETSFNIKGFDYKVAYETKEPTKEEFIEKSSGLLDGKGGYIK